LRVEEKAEVWPAGIGQLQEKVEWEFDQAEFLCVGLIVRPVADLYLPWMKVLSSYGDWIWVPLFGPTGLQVSENRYCGLCFTESNGDGGRVLCKSCREREEQLGLACRMKECGAGLQECRSEEAKFEEKKDFRIYVGAFGELMWLGISCKRELEDLLLKKGIDRVLIFTQESGGFSSEAVKQYYDRLEAEYDFDRENFLLMVENLGSGSELMVQKLQALGREVEQRYGLKMEAFLDYKEHYFNVPKQPAFYPAKEGWLMGEVVGAKGSVLFIRWQGKIWAYNGAELLGRKLLNVRG